MALLRRQGDQRREPRPAADRDRRRSSGTRRRGARRRPATARRRVPAAGRLSTPTACRARCRTTSTDSSARRSAAALEKTGHNRTAAAKLLGITFRALRYRMQRLAHQLDDATVRPRRASAGGWIGGVRTCRRPTATRVRPARAIDTLVIHHISLPPGEFGGACDRAPLHQPARLLARIRTSRDLRDLHVSAHFLLRRDGELLQFVSAATSAPGMRASRPARARSAATTSRSASSSKAAADGPSADTQYRRLAPLIARAARRAIRCA